MTEQRKRKAAKVPVSAHPAFPAIVSLWFAALLGLGSLVLPIALFEGLSEASGLSALVVAAQPPLGVTARIAIALAATATGALLGLAIARRVVSANAPKPAARRVAAKRPISAREELGEGGLDAEFDDAPRGPIPGRRRPLSVTDDSARSEFFDHAPLPGVAAAHVSEPEPEFEPDALDLTAFEAEPAQHGPVCEPQGESVMTEDIAGPARWSEHTEPFGTGTLSSAPRFASPDPAPEQRAVAELAPVEDAEAVGLDRPLAALGMAELVERFARALDQHRVAAPATEETGAGPVLDVSFAFAARPLSSVDAGLASAALPAALRPVEFGEARDEFDEEGESADLGLTLAPAPLSPFTAPVAETADEPGDDDDAAAEADEGYSSLLAMRGAASLSREPVRIEDEPEDQDDAVIEPVVIFPGQARHPSPAFDGAPNDIGAASTGQVARPFDAPSVRADAAMNGFAVTQSSFAANSGDTERALREALEKLQKMSGAA